MPWQISWRVISGGPGGPREDESGNFYTGELVKFTISLSPDTTDYLAITTQAGQPRFWERPPQMTVIGEDHGREVSVVARHVPGNALEIDYLFRYEGNKRLVFEGTPAAYDIRQLSRTPQRGRRRMETAFDALRIRTQVRVQPFQIGEHAQTTAGRSRDFQQAEDNLGSIRERIQADRETAERLERSSQQVDDEEQRRVRESERPSSEDSQGVRRAYRHGLLHYRMKDEAQVQRLNGRELEEYLSGLEAAIRITPGFRLYEAGEGSRPMGAFRALDRWQVEYRPRRNQIAFFLHGSLSATRTQEGNEFVDRYPTAESTREYRESRRRETLHLFPENGWVVVQTSAGGPKYIIPVRELARSIESDRFWNLISGMATLTSMVVTAGTSTPAVALAEIGFEILAQVFFPREMQQMIAGASIVRGLVRGVQALLQLGRRSLSRIRTLRRAAGAPEGTPDDATLSTSVPESPAVPDVLPPRGLGRRRPVYRGPSREVEGYYDRDGRAIVGEGHEVTRIPRSTGEVLALDSTREYRIAQAVAHDGREVVRLPETAGEWDLLIRQQGWSRTRVSQLRQRVRDAQIRDGLDTARNPDLLINGRIWDVLSQGPRGDLNSGVDSALLTLIGKGATRQTRRVIVDFTGYSASLPQIRASFRRSLSALEATQPDAVRDFSRYIDEVSVVVGGRVFPISSRGQGISF